jgi:hypothetical protein
MTARIANRTLCDHWLQETRRFFFGRAAAGLGAAALGSLLNPRLFAAASAKRVALPGDSAIMASPHHPARAKRVIWLFMADGPSQLDLFDYKPQLKQYYDQDLPASIRMGQRITTMTSGQTRLPVAPSMFGFQQRGSQGTWLSDLIPHVGAVIDDLCVIKTVHTEAINHDPAITYIQTGSQIPGRPSLGAWLSYGIGSPNADLPAYVVLHSRLAAGSQTQALFARLWGSGFLPAKHQGVALRSTGDPVLYLSNPPGVEPATRRKMLDALAELNAKKQEQIGDPEILSRIAQYEMAFRMQTSVPELVDVSQEPQHVLDLYGPEVKEPGTYAYNCLLARRLAERGVRFTQVFLRGWDHHNNLPKQLPDLCKAMDQPTAGLIRDLKQRGLLDDTLVVWGGEFGRTVYSQGTLTQDNYGRDHHPRNFTMWLAGGGVKPGFVFGETDDFSYNVVSRPMHIHDLNATILHLLGIHHEQLTFRYQGRDFRLTDVHGNVANEILA